MPHRINEFRAKIQFITFAAMPSMISEACQKGFAISNTVYVQHAVCEALSRDLGIPLDHLLAKLPEPRGKAAVPFGADRKPMWGPANTIETVK